MGDELRTTKRARHACEPCRRKKSRCPGERPACSYCLRLGQACVYAIPESDAVEGRSDRHMENRMSSLEGKMDQLIQQLSPHLGNNQSGFHSSKIDSQQHFPGADTTGGRASLSVDNAPTIKDVGYLYLKWCHRQPISLFKKETFIESLSARDPELVLALRALSLRFPPRAITEPTELEMGKMAQSSREMVMRKLALGTVELSTMQTLCILSMVDFATGRIMQADLSLTIANALINSLIGQHETLGDTLYDSQEFKDCVCAISMLHNIQGNVVTAPLISVPSRVLLSNPPPCEKDAQDIFAYASRISEVWQAARTYAASRPSLDTPPPWTPTSDYSRVMQQHVDIDVSVPLRFRFHANRIDKQDPENLQRLREYWGPWLFIQFVYLVVPCLLNHPFLLSLRLRGFRHTMPHSFIQQSFEQITRYSGWFGHFLDVLEEKQFAVSDPTLAHCIAILATIHLQHSFVVDSSLREEARSGFDKCLNFLRRMRSMWKSVDGMVGVSSLLPSVGHIRNHANNSSKVENLDRLHRSVASTSNTAQVGSNGNESGWTVDAQLLWDILIYERSGTDASISRRPVLGSTLVSNYPTATEADFDLIGSVGIYGHKTVAKDTPMYAPSDAVAPLRRTVFSGQGSETPSGLGELARDILSQEDIFLGPVEYGQAIETWMDHGVV